MNLQEIKESVADNAGYPDWNALVNEMRDGDTFDSYINLILYKLIKDSPDWINVNDRLPEIGQRFISFSQIGNSRDIYAIRDMTIHMGLWSFEYAKITYWMALPQSPTK